MTTTRVLLLTGAALLVAALLLPWWVITMHAPQYPNGLHVTTWFYKITGDVREVNGLNHYIGFMPLAQIAPTERLLALYLGPLAVICEIIAAFVRSRVLAALLVIPAVLIPPFFLVDTAAWLNYAGNHLDPYAALSSSVSPWTPPLFGNGGVGQFQTQSSFGLGFYVSVLGGICALAAAFQLSRPKHVNAS